MENEIFPIEWKKLLDAAGSQKSKMASDTLFNNVTGLMVAVCAILAMIALAPAIEEFSRVKSTSTTQLERDINRAKAEIEAENYNGFVRSAAKAQIILDK